MRLVCLQEQVLGFSDVSSDHSARALSEHVLVEGCRKAECRSNVRRASVIHGALFGIQRFMHCFAHALNLIVTQSISFISQ